MEEKMIDFIEEFTDNFSELCIETFMIRFLNNFGEKDLLEGFKLLQHSLNKNIKNYILEKQKNIKDSNKKTQKSQKS